MEQTTINKPNKISKENNENKQLKTNFEVRKIKKIGTNFYE